LTTHRNEKGENVNTLSNLRIVMMAGMLLTMTYAPSAHGTAEVGSAKVIDSTIDKPASTGSSSKKNQANKNRRSSGKQIIEEKAGKEAKPDREHPQQNEDRSSGTTLKFGSGGGGVTGATGR
jgi:hypothetical protein